MCDIILEHVDRGWAVSGRPFPASLNFETCRSFLGAGEYDAMAEAEPVMFLKQVASELHLRHLHCGSGSFRICMSLLVSGMSF